MLIFDIRNLIIHINKKQNEIKILQISNSGWERI